MWEALVQGVDKDTAEEFFGRLVSSAQILSDASRDYARDGEPVSSVACALGADVATLGSVVWERLNIAPRSPQRQFFEAASAVMASLGGLGSGPGGTVTAADVLTATRARLAASFDASLADDVATRWPGIEHLGGMPAPTQDDVDADVLRRLEGLRPGAFVEARRAAALSAMRVAQDSRIRGEIPEAIQAAYESDYLSLEAYLVESATAAGDAALFTVTTRWVLATHSLSALTGLPPGFPEAVACIRDALVDGLGDADGTRLRSTLVPA